MTTPPAVPVPNEGVEPISDEDRELLMRYLAGVVGDERTRAKIRALDARLTAAERQRDAYKRIAVNAKRELAIADHVCKERWTARCQAEAERDRLAGLLSEAHLALADMLAGWRYIRNHHGDLYGVGWDRCEEAAQKVLASLVERKESA